MQQTFFRDPNGHITLWQYPNIALWGWIITIAINHFAKNEKLAAIGTAFLLAWAIMELVSGVNYFRRLLGLLVIVVVVLPWFR